MRPQHLAPYILVWHWPLSVIDPRNSLGSVWETLEVPEVGKRPLEEGLKEQLCRAS